MWPIAVYVLNVAISEAESQNGRYALDVDHSGSTAATTFNAARAIVCRDPPVFASAAHYHELAGAHRP